MKTFHFRNLALLVAASKTSSSKYSQIELKKSCNYLFNSAKFILNKIYIHRKNSL